MDKESKLVAGLLNTEYYHWINTFRENLAKGGINNLAIRPRLTPFPMSIVNNLVSLSYKQSDAEKFFTSRFRQIFRVRNKLFEHIVISVLKSTELKSIPYITLRRRPNPNSTKLCLYLGFNFPREKIGIHPLNTEIGGYPHKEGFQKDTLTLFSVPENPTSHFLGSFLGTLSSHIDIDFHVGNHSALTDGLSHKLGYVYPPYDLAQLRRDLENSIVFERGDTLFKGINSFIIINFHGRDRVDMLLSSLLSLYSKSRMYSLLCKAVQALIKVIIEDSIFAFGESISKYGISRKTNYYDELMEKVGLGIRENSKDSILQDLPDVKFENHLLQCFEEVSGVSSHSELIRELVHGVSNSSYSTPKKKKGRPLHYNIDAEAYYYLPNKCVDGVWRTDKKNKVKIRVKNDSNIEAIPNESRITAIQT